jgi:hypothetical protein
MLGVVGVAVKWIAGHVPSVSASGALLHGGVAHVP